MKNRIGEAVINLINLGKYESSSGGKNSIRHLTNLSYQLVTGKSNNDLIHERKILKGDTIKDYLYIKEKENLPEAEDKIINLLYKGLKYNDIKRILINNKKND